MMTLLFAAHIVPPEPPLIGRYEIAEVSLRKVMQEKKWECVLWSSVEYTAIFRSGSLVRMWLRSWMA